MKNYIKRKLALTDKGASDLIKATVSSFVSYSANMIPAILLMVFLDDILYTNSISNKVFYILSAVIIFLLYMVLNIEYNSLYTTTYKESENLRIEVARTLKDLPLSYYSKHDLSDLAQTIMGDVAGIEHALSHAAAKTFGFVLFFIVISIMLLAGNIKLGIMVILPTLLFFLLLYISKKMQVKNYDKYYVKLRENTESFQQTIELQQEIKSLGLADEKRSELYKQVEEGESIHIKTETIAGLTLTLSNLSLYLALIAVIVGGCTMLIRGEINILYFIGYLLAAMKIKDGAEGVGMFISELFYIDSMSNRINEIKNTETQHGQDLHLKKFDISLENVDFSYDEDTPVLKDVSFTAKQGEVTALIGRSGCGKSSILKLISRLYDYDNGAIKIDGKDIKDISTNSLFSCVSIVFQDVTLFNTTVLENIRIGNLAATDEEVIAAAKLANCHEFVNKMPDGYNSVIGENGASLSGGERQRISIARAFLKDAPIVILDEIAASLDVENEKIIQDSLNKLIENKTVVIISHRLKSIENVDKIVVIDDGKVEAAGNHEYLLNYSEVYKTLIEKSRLASQFTY